MRDIIDEKLREQAEMNKLKDREEQSILSLCSTSELKAELRRRKGKQHYKNKKF